MSDTTPGQPGEVTPEQIGQFQARADAARPARERAEAERIARGVPLPEGALLPDGWGENRRSEAEQLWARYEKLSLENLEPWLGAWLGQVHTAREVSIRAADKLIDLTAAGKARRELDAQGWKPPQSQPLAAELLKPRETHIHRIPSLAGWNHNILLFGPRKVGKTALEVNLTAGLSLSSCQPGPDGGLLWTPGRFLGFTECYMGGNVACLNAEMDADDWRDEFRRLPQWAYDPARIFPLHMRGEPFPVIASAAARAWFVAWLRRNQIEVLFIDTWGQFCSANGVRNFNDDAEARVILKGLDEIKRASYVKSLAVLIHTPHQVPGQKHLERFKGAGAVGDWADVLWSYLRDDEGTRYLSAVGRARIDQPETSIAWDAETGLMAWGETGSRAATSAGRQRDKMIAALEKAGGKGLLTEDLLDAAGGHQATARKLAKDMAGSGDLETRRNGNAIRYFLPGLAS